MSIDLLGLWSLAFLDAPVDRGFQNNSQRTVTSALEKQCSEFSISEADLRAIARKRMAELKAGHEAKKQQRVP